jgi:hypothetical protein
MILGAQYISNPALRSYSIRSSATGFDHLSSLCLSFQHYSNSGSTIMDGLNSAKKAQLHEIADLMLEIYRTLARMQYLDPSWIREGPHNVDALLPLYHSLGLDPSITYLYSILAYVDTAGAAVVDFFQGGMFADFRKKNDVEQGRDPFYEQSGEESNLRPWMTPLSLLGNHRSVIIYDARKHRIGILDQESCGSTDHNLYEGWTAVQETGEDEDDACRDEKKGEDEDDEEKMEENEEEVDYDEEEDEDDNDDKEEDSDGFEGPYDEMDSRPAGNVLRDIVRWYHELIEIPGGGEASGSEWNDEIVKPLYLKHGWPNANFDGHAFLVDQARAAAAAEAKYSSEEPIRKVSAYEGWLEEPDSPAMRQRKDRLAAPETIEEEWSTRWELWWTEMMRQRNLIGLQKARKARDFACPGGQCQKPEELPLWEMGQLQQDLWSRQRSLEALQKEADEMEAGERETVPGIEFKLRHAEKQVLVYREAYKASRSDAERLCPGRSFPLGPGVKARGLDLEARKEELTKNIEEAQWRSKAIQGWMNQLPNGANGARAQAQSALDREEEYIEVCMKQNRGVAQALEECN